MLVKPIVLIVRLGFAALFVVFTALGKPFLWLILFVVGLLLTPLFGRLYCGWACPMNTVMTPFSKWLRKAGRKQKPAPAWLEHGWFAWLSLLLSLAVTIVGRQVFKKNIPILLVWFVIALAVTCFYKTSVFHNLICPFGAPLRLLGRFARFSRTVDKNRCQAHANCLRVCPSEAIQLEPSDGLAAIDPSLCHQCLNCTAACPSAAIGYTKRSVAKRF